MTTREILTLQFGHYSNYIGTHFWNIQEQSFDYTGTVKTEVNHDILYREGQTSKGEVTYTPRLLLADLKGSLNTFSLNGGLSNDTDTQEEMAWDSIEKIEDPPPERNEYIADLESGKSTEKDYDLDSNVTSWTDFLFPRFHSRTVNIVRDYQHGNENERFDMICTGHKLWKSEFGDSFSDNIRKYLEECDSMQGFQINFDCVDGFSGLALGCIEHLADEYSKPILAYPVIASHFSDNICNNQEERDKSNLKDSTRLINIALSLQELADHATMFVPICTGDKGWRKPGSTRTFEHVNYNPELYYHSTAILASAIDTLSIKYRLKSNDYTLSDTCADMTGYGRKLTAASLGMPFSISESKYVIEHLNELTKPIYTAITPSCKIASDKIFQMITVRGIPESYLKATQKEAKAKEQQGLPAYRCTSLKEMFELYFQANNFLSATNVTIAEKPLQIKAPFPRIFSDALNKYGMVRNAENAVEKVESIPVMAGYHNGSFISDMLEKVHREVGRIKFAKLHKFTEEGLEASDYKESLDRLAEFKDNYEDDFEL